MEDITHKCDTALKDITTGWYNIYAKQFNIYQSSNNKLRKLITGIEYMMEVRAAVGLFGGGN